MDIQKPPFYYVFHFNMKHINKLQLLKEKGPSFCLSYNYN